MILVNNKKRQLRWHINALGPDRMCPSLRVGIAVVSYYRLRTAAVVPPVQFRYRRVAWKFQLRESHVLNGGMANLALAKGLASTRLQHANTLVVCITFSQEVGRPSFVKLARTRISAARKAYLVCWRSIPRRQAMARTLASLVEVVSGRLR